VAVEGRRWRSAAVAVARGDRPTGRWPATWRPAAANEEKKREGEIMRRS